MLIRLLNPVVCTLKLIAVVCQLFVSDHSYVIEEVSYSLILLASFSSRLVCVCVCVSMVTKTLAEAGFTMSVVHCCIEKHPSSEAGSLDR